MALLAWKLDGSGTIVDDVIIHNSGVIGGSRGVYRRKGGRNSKYKEIICKQMHGMIDAMLTVFESSTKHLAQSGNSSGDELPAPGDYQQTMSRGEGSMFGMLEGCGGRMDSVF